MYRKEWRRPGCIVTAIIMLIAWVMSVPMADAERPWLVVVVRVAAVWVLARLYAVLLARKIAICPKCGVATNPAFDYCRASGKAKYQA